LVTLEDAETSDSSKEARTSRKEEGKKSKAHTFNSGGKSKRQPLDVIETHLQREAAADERIKSRTWDRRKKKEMRRVITDVEPPKKKGK